jgi:N-acetylglucosaminyldiphosphoundecaprenol N-acetyl-beta-D-mannosaminyltransferase
LYRAAGAVIRASQPRPGDAAAVSESHRLRIGRLWIDAVTFDDALRRIAALVESGAGGAVFTPNVDHVMTAETNPEFRSAYRAADLALADGRPLIWASRVLGLTLPEKVSGSDLILPLARIAGERGWRVYLLGGEPGVAAAAGERLRAEYGVNIVGVDDAIVRIDHGDEERRAITNRIAAARAQLLLVALGAPKQELWITQVRAELGPAVAIGVGASLDFVAGRVRRAPRWMSDVGLEWTYRLMQEPRRLWRRYLLRGPLFLLIVFRARRVRRAQRVRLARSTRGPEATQGQ